MDGLNDFFTDGKKIYWSNSKAQTLKTTDGQTLKNIGSSITVVTTSFIPKPNDVPFFGAAAAGDKLQSAITITGNYDSKDHFSGFSAKSSTWVGQSFDCYFLDGADKVEGKTNSFSAMATSDGYKVSLEKHTEANWKEVGGLDALGSRVDVNQKISITINSAGKMSFDIGHGTYPSVRMSLSGLEHPISIYQYSARSFLYSHANNLLSDQNYEGQAMMQQRTSDAQNAGHRTTNQATFNGFTSAPFLWHASLNWFMYK